MPSSRPDDMPIGRMAQWAMAWLIPGAGFCLHGRWARGLTHLLLVTVTFGMGLALRGGVQWPSWSPSAPDFNLINNLAFIVQMAAGLPAVASLTANLAGWTWLGGTPWHAYAELGGYYLIVAGAINYFSLCNFNDRLLAPPASHEIRGQATGGRTS